MLKVPKEPKKSNTLIRKPSATSSSTSDESQKKFYIETIAKFCDKCGAAYTTANVNVVQESNFSSIIHFSCSSCKSNHIATFVKPIGMSSRVPVNTDLTVEEISRFAKKENVSTNDVLDLYEFLDTEDMVKSF